MKALEKSKKENGICQKQLHQNLHEKASFPQTYNHNLSSL